MQCLNCGKDNPEGTKFCENCGGLLSSPVITPPSSYSANPIPVAQVQVNPQKKKSYDTMWVIGGILGLIALFCSNKILAAILAVISLVLLIIAGLGLLKMSKLKGIFVLVVAAIVFFFTGIGFLTSGRCSGFLSKIQISV